MEKIEWTRFYTESKTNQELVDQIEIDIKNQTYRLFLDQNQMITDGFDEWDREITSHYVDRFIFDCIVKGVKEQFNPTEHQK